jgi:hypothetical protein
MTRIVVALAAGIGGIWLAAPAHAQAPSSPSTPATTAAPTVVPPGPVMISDGYTTTRRGLFGRRNRTTYSGPVYGTPGFGPAYGTPTTTGPVPMPGASTPGTTPSTTPSSQPVGDPAALPSPRTAPGTITSSSYYPGTTSGTTTPPPGTMIINGRVVQASGTITMPDGKVVPAAGTIVTIDSPVMPADYSTSSQPARRGLFGRLRNR